MPTLLILIASTRPGRVACRSVNGSMPAHAHTAPSRSSSSICLELDLPFMDEPAHPRLRRYTKKHTKEWSAKVAAADAFVFVMPEYNYGFTAPLKNAIDFLHEEWKYKPVGLVSYGGVAAGTRAAQMLKLVLTTLKMTPLFEAVSIPFVTQFIDEQGNFQANELIEHAADAMFDELVRVSEALRPLRAEPAQVP